MLAMRTSNGSIDRARRQFDRTPDVEILLADDLAEAVAASDPRGDMTRSIADPGHRRPAAGARRRLVRDGAAQPGHGAGPTRHVRRLHRAAARDRRARLRRRLSDADPSDRHDQPQGQEQFAEGRARRSGQPLRHRQLAGRPRRGASRARHARRLPPLRRCLPRPRTWRWRSTSPSSARRIIPG